MTYKDMKVTEIMNDSQYPLAETFRRVIERIDAKTSNIKKVVRDDAVAYSNRDIEFAKIVPQEEYVDLIVEVPYDRIIDLSHKCDVVERFAGFYDADIVSYKIRINTEIQYGLSLFDQTYTYIKRLKLD